MSLGVTLRQRHTLAPTGNQWARSEGPSFSPPPFSERIRGRDGGGNALSFPGLAGGRLSEARRLCVPSRRLRTHFIPGYRRELCRHRPGHPGGWAVMVRVAGLRWSWLSAEKSLGVATEHEALPWPSGPELHALPPTSSRLCRAVFLEALNSVPLKPWAPYGNVQKWVPGNPKRLSILSSSPLGWGSSRSVDNSQPPTPYPTSPNNAVFLGVGRNHWVSALDPPPSPKKKKRHLCGDMIWFLFTQQFRASQGVGMPVFVTEMQS